MAELRAGGLAIVISAIREDNVGKCCRLIKIVESRETFLTPHGIKRNLSGRKLWLVEGDVIATNLTNTKTWHGWALFHPRKLMPIDGDDFTHEDEREKELVNG